MKFQKFIRYSLILRNYAAKIPEIYDIISNHKWCHSNMQLKYVSQHKIAKIA